MNKRTRKEIVPILTTGSSESGGGGGGSAEVAWTDSKVEQNLSSLGAIATNTSHIGKNPWTNEDVVETTTTLNKIASNTTPTSPTWTSVKVDQSLASLASIVSNTAAGSGGGSQTGGWTEAKVDQALVELQGIKSAIVTKRVIRPVIEQIIYNISGQVSNGAIKMKDFPNYKAADTPKVDVVVPSGNICLLVNHDLFFTPNTVVVLITAGISYEVSVGNEAVWVFIPLTGASSPFIIDLRFTTTVEGVNRDIMKIDDIREDFTFGQLCQFFDDFIRFDRLIA